MSNLVSTLEWLVDIPSVTREEEAIANGVQEMLLDYPSYQVRRWRHGLVATPVAVEAKFLLVGHLDTVPPSPQQTRRREDGRIYGCGTSDMKAGVAVMLEVLRARPEAPVAYLFYDREEGPLAENGLFAGRLVGHAQGAQCLVGPVDRFGPCFGNLSTRLWHQALP